MATRYYLDGIVVWWLADKKNIITKESLSFLKCKNGLTGVGLYQRINEH